MAWLYPQLVRPILFRLDPEQAHHLTVQALRVSGALPLSQWLVKRLLGIQRLPQIRSGPSGCSSPTRSGWRPVMIKMAWPGAV